MIRTVGQVVPSNKGRLWRRNLRHIALIVSGPNAQIPPGRKGPPAAMRTRLRQSAERAGRAAIVLLLGKR